MVSVDTCTMPRSRWSIRAGAWSRSPIGMRRTRRNATSATGWRNDRAVALASMAVVGARTATGTARARSDDDAADAGPDSAARSGGVVAGAIPDAPCRPCTVRVEPRRDQRNVAGVVRGRGLDAAADAGCGAGKPLGGAGEIRQCAAPDRRASGVQLAAGGVRRTRRVAGRNPRDDIPFGLAVHGVPG